MSSRVTMGLDGRAVRRYFSEDTAIARCGCKGSRRVDLTCDAGALIYRVARGSFDRNDSSETIRAASVCWTCGKRLKVRALEFVIKPDHKCDARCTGATGHNCECSCGGKNHGAHS